MAHTLTPKAEYTFTFSWELDAIDGRAVNENYLYKWVSVKVVDFARTVAEILVKLLDDV